MTFVNKNETSRYESVQGTPLPSSKVYDSAKKVSYFEQAFKIEAKIGSGCFGNVYRVKSKEDGKKNRKPLKEGAATPFLAIIMVFTITQRIL